MTRRETEFSRCGGLWTDREDVHQLLLSKLYGGELDRVDAQRLHAFIDDGYLVFEHAVAIEVIDELNADLDPILKGGNDVVDPYAVLESARAALLAAPVTRFLTLLFEDTPLLFAGIAVERISGVRTDLTPTTTPSPLDVAACWLPLDDVHGDAPKLGAARRTFLPRKGDALIWAADLGYGGWPVAELSRTPRSLAAQYCANAVDPPYFEHEPEHRVKCPFDGGCYASRHHRVEGATNGIHRPSNDTIGRRRFARRIFGRGED